MNTIFSQKAGQQIFQISSPLSQYMFGKLLPAEQLDILTHSILPGKIRQERQVLKLLNKTNFSSSALNKLLIVAVKSGRHKIVRKVLQKLDYKVTSQLLRTCLIETIKHGDLKLATFLLNSRKFSLATRFIATSPMISSIFGNLRADSKLDQFGGLEVEVHRQARQAGIINTIQAQENEVEHRRTSKTRTSSPKHSKLQITKWRYKNPEDREHLISLPEIVEQQYFANHNKISNKPLGINIIIDRALNEWSTVGFFSRENFSQLLRTLHPESKTITNSNLYGWKNRPNKIPYRESLQIIKEAFDLTDLHELMLWRIACGTKQRRSLESYAANLARELELNQCNKGQSNSERSARGVLVDALIKQSGISSSRIEQMLEVQQLWQWRKGARIQDPAIARKFVELTNPLNLLEPDKQAKASELNAKLINLLTGQVTTIKQAIELSKSYSNPGGQLLKLLTGRYGLKPLATTSLAKLLNTSINVVSRLRSSTKVRGSQIEEFHAHKIADFILELDSNNKENITPELLVERELLIESLTGIANPTKLFEQFKNHKLGHIGDVISLTRKRRGVVQISATTELESGAGYVGIRKARELANFIGFVGAENKEIRRQFILAAMGKDYQLELGDIIDQGVRRELSAVQTLRKLIYFSGMSQGQVVNAIGLKPLALQHACSTKGAGVISKHSAIIQLGKLLDLEQFSEEMIKLFGKA